MPMLDDADLSRLIRYVSGECGPDEAADAERWIAEDATRTQAADTMRRVWAEGAVLQAVATTAADAVEWEVDTAWQEFVSPRPRAGKTLQLIPTDTRARSWWSRRRVAPAAVAVVILALPALLQVAEHVTTPDTTARADAAAGREFRTAPAQRAQIRLSDGTLAVLAPASRLWMPAAYGVSSRELQLEGEAYFEVRHDASRPFRVRTARGVTEDIGTKFAVRAYAGDTVERIAVTEGAVRLRAAEAADTAAATLMAGQLGVLSTSGVPAVTAVRDIERYVAWTEGRLLFRNTSLGEVAVQLGRWYGLEVRVLDPAVRRLLFTGAFRDESVAEVLRSLEIALDIRARRVGDVVTLDHSAKR